ncbi:MAG TPA: sigma 54-interacting transcriptional regulator [Syntrophorhabdaceae bacterium]|nr:sigma 54-interacting transcriptional regulator [Syntrophorhabdaceae bacterium]
MKTSELDREITQLKKRIRELEERNRDLMGMIENTHDALCIVDGESRLLMANPAFERVMETSNSEIVGRKIRDLVKEGMSDTGASLHVINTGKPQTVVIKMRSGKEVLSTGVPVFDQNGKIDRIYCNLRDITELNRLKEECAQSQKLISKYLVELNEVKRLRTMRSQFIAHSKEMKQIMETVYRIARVDTTVLLLGESGVGKDLIARILHEASPREEMGTFIKINCGAIPADLLESELFGYEPGAFTGASKEGKAGYFEIADRGTLFLDEIGDLPLRLQVKLLTVIQDQEITRVGGVKPKKVDVRIIAATNRDLEKMVKYGKFREDLYYRLNVVPVLIPPLRQRREDIPFLLVHYLDRYGKKYGLEAKLTKDVVDILCSYRWPGNVRELANLLEHLLVVTNEHLIKPEHLPKKYSALGGTAEDERENLADIRSLKDEVRKHEQAVIKRILGQASTLEEASQKLGVSISTLTRRLRLIRFDSQ